MSISVTEIGSGSTTGGATFSLGNATTVPPGSLLVCPVFDSAATAPVPGATTGIYDDAGHTYHSTGPIFLNNTTGNGHANIFWIGNVALTSAQKIHYNGNGTYAGAMAFMISSIRALDNPTDQSANMNFGTSDPMTVTSRMPQSLGELLFGFTCSKLGGVPGINSPWSGVGSLSFSSWRLTAFTTINTVLATSSFSGNGGAETSWAAMMLNFFPLIEQMSDSAKFPGAGKVGARASQVMNIKASW